MFENLTYKIERLKPIAKKVAQEYQQKAPFLLDEVNKILENNAQIKDLLGDNSLDLMYENHKNHLSFMRNIFIINDFKLLTRTVCWVYKSYHKRGFAYQYFILQYKAWQDAIKKELSQESSKEINQVYDWLLNNHSDFINISQQLKKEEYKIPNKWQDEYQTLLELLLAGSSQKCFEFASQVVNSKEELKEFFLEVIQPAMYTIGDLWGEGKITVAKEHLASSIVARIISLLYAEFLDIKQNKGEVIISAVPNEYHELGARMVADLLELDGWNVYYLGADTPQKELIELIKEIKPCFLGLSVALSFNLEGILKIIQKVRSSSEISKTKILVGGYVLNNNPDLWKRLDADSYANNGREAIKIARKWWEANEDY